MVIALLVVLGVNLVVIVVFGATVVSRKRWVRRQPGVFRDAIRASTGESDGLRPKWSRGYRLNVAKATVEIAASDENGQLMLGPYRQTLQ
jgi:hypothetical protein